MRLRRFGGKTLNRLGIQARARGRFVPPPVHIHPYPYVQEHEIECEINLGTDHSIVEPPKFISEALKWAYNNNLNQYNRFMGYIPLVEEISKAYSGKIGKKLDPMSEILVSAGSTGAFNTITWSTLRAGDEVVLFEPYYFPWHASLRQRGINVKFVPLAEDGSLDAKALDQAITSNTKMLVFDNPSLADGNVIQPSELQQIANIVSKHKDLIVVSNESLHKQTIDYSTHQSFASLPGMFERTLTLFSGGMEFDCRGFRMGWIIGPADYIVHQGTYQSYTIYSTQTPGMVNYSFFNFK